MYNVIMFIDSILHTCIYCYYSNFVNAKVISVHVSLHFGKLKSNFQLHWLLTIMHNINNIVKLIV